MLYPEPARAVAGADCMSCRTIIDIRKHRSDMILFAFFYALYFFIYASFFSSCELGMHQDELADYNHQVTGMYVAAGRWALGVYRVLSWGYSGAVCMLVSGFYLCCSLFIQRKTLKIESRYSFLLYGVVSLSTVQFAHHLRFNMQADTGALSILLASAACCLISPENKLKGLVAGGLCLAAAIGLYQSSLLVFLCLAVGRAVMALSRGEAVRPSLKLLIAPVVVSAMAVVVSSLLAWFGKRFFCNSRFLEIATQYQTSFIKTPLYWDRELMLHTWYIHLKGLLKAMAGWSPWCGLFYALAWIPLCLSAVCQFRRYGLSRAVWLCALSLLLLGAPFAFAVAFAAGSFHATWVLRTYLAAPCACATIWACCSDCFLWNGGRISRFSLPSILGPFVGVLFAAYHAAAVSQLNSLAFMPRHIDSLMVEYEGRKLAASYGDDLDTLKIVCLTPASFTNPHYPYLTEAPFLRNLTFDVPEQYKADASLLEKMPVWPAHGSMVRVAPGVVIVHFPTRVWYAKKRPGIFDQ